MGLLGTQSRTAWTIIGISLLCILLTAVYYEHTQNPLLVWKDGPQENEIEHKHGVDRRMQATSNNFLSSEVGNPFNIQKDEVKSETSRANQTTRNDVNLQTNLRTQADATQKTQQIMARNSPAKIKNYKQKKEEAMSTLRHLETSSKETYMINSYKPEDGHYCNVFDYSVEIDTSDRNIYKCVVTRTKPPVQICIYPTHMDVFVSGSILQKGAWELNINVGIINALKRYPSAAFLDIGANLGMHGLVAAKSGRKMVAVEPKWNNIKRLQKSIKLNNMTDDVTLVMNAVYNSRGTLSLYSDNTNQGGSNLNNQRLAHEERIQSILFDDLLEVFTAKEAVIKMDIEATECKALMNSTHFFATVKVHAIFMEFMNLKKSLGVGKPSHDKMCVLNMVVYLRSMGFQPRAIDPAYRFLGRPALLDSGMSRWPGDIVWIRPWAGLNGAKNHPTATI